MYTNSLFVLLIIKGEVMKWEQHVHKLAMRTLGPKRAQVLLTGRGFSRVRYQSYIIIVVVVVVVVVVVLFSLRSEWFVKS